jgi:serine O-acetyltransferase
MSSHPYQVDLHRAGSALDALQGELTGSGLRAPDPAPFVHALRQALFPHFRTGQDTTAELLAQLHDAAHQLAAQALGTPQTWPDHLIDALPTIAAQLYADAAFTLAQDPAAHSLDEVITTYPGYAAIVIHRVASAIHLLDVPLIPRLLAELAHAQTGIDIHPGATIASPFCIDHGTGVVIGQTAVVGKNVVLYQGVTLGALRISKAVAGTKRHPTIQDDVVIYANATVLGGNTVIGARSVIGGNTWITRSVPPDSTVLRKPDLPIPTNAGDEYTI